ncbi:uncharacterized protein LOC131595162 [Vicia villosa]|uniref:uncharacterized protein LOC131595162 n=1 Tax=Vicia villosa TaxID=3911 RepID=UPI00273BF5A8|nr:uncharacterized protein LOC131595162 [Vicia villosa]
MSEAVANSFWCCPEISFSSSNSMGRSGGLITLWKKDNMEVLASFRGEGFLGIKGKKFSWYSGDGKSKSRIDRFLISNSVVNRDISDISDSNDWRFRFWPKTGGYFGYFLYPPVCQMIGDRDISDHCPIWIMTDNYNWGPKPFKFNNEWFSNDSFVPFVEKEWKSYVVHGRGDYILKEKLRLLKDKIKIWNREVFGKIDLEIEEGVHDINIVD